MRLSFFLGSDERPRLPHLSERESSPDFLGRADSLMRDCFFCGGSNSTVGAVVMISGAIMLVNSCHFEPGGRN
jgi:hypothetical protein